jgi:hypothetical protein
LIAATLRESQSERMMACFAPVAVTALQNVFHPIDTLQRQNSTPAPWVVTESENPWLTSAAIGMRTINERYATMSAPPPPARRGKASFDRMWRQPVEEGDVDGERGGVGVCMSRAVAIIVLRGVRPKGRTGSTYRPPQRAPAIALIPMEVIDISKSGGTTGSDESRFDTTAIGPRNFR